MNEFENVSTNVYRHGTFPQTFWSLNVYENDLENDYKNGLGNVFTNVLLRRTFPIATVYV